MTPGLLRGGLPRQNPDLAVPQFAHENGCLLVTCNRDDFSELT